MMATASSTEAYDREQRSGQMPSLTLAPAGADRLTMRRHLLDWGLGTRPRGLTWTHSAAAGGSGPTKEPRITSVWTCSHTTARCSIAEGWLPAHDCNGCTRSKQTWKTNCSPSSTYRVNCWTGWEHNAGSSETTLNGEGAQGRELAWRLQNKPTVQRHEVTCMKMSATNNTHKPRDKIRGQVDH